MNNCIWILLLVFSTSLDHQRTDKHQSQTPKSCSMTPPQGILLHSLHMWHDGAEQAVFDMKPPPPSKVGGPRLRLMHYSAQQGEHGALTCRCTAAACNQWQEHLGTEDVHNAGGVSFVRWRTGARHSERSSTTCSDVMNTWRRLFQSFIPFGDFLIFTPILGGIQEHSCSEQFGPFQAAHHYWMLSLRPDQTAPPPPVV